MESILISTKKILGIPETVTYFDNDLVMHINTVLGILTQLGVGPEEGFSISNSNTSWNEFISDDTSLEMVKSYVGLKVRMIFDPPVSSAVAEAINRNISELEWRILVNTEKENN